MKMSKHQFSIFLGVVLIVLIFVVAPLAIYRVYYDSTFSQLLSSRHAEETYSVPINYDEPLQFSYDVTKVAFEGDGVTLTSTNDSAEVILLDKIKVPENGKLEAFSADESTPGSSEIEYQLTADGKNWYYHDGNTWEVIGLCAECGNTADEIADHASEFSIENGKLQVKALLTSDNVNIPELRSLDLQISGQVEVLSERESEIRSLFMATAAGSGAIWTTRGDCGGESQDVNHFPIGAWIYINGSNFDPNTEHDWDITGNPGGSSCDPRIEVAGGAYSTDGDGAFCLQAYEVQPGDCGEYKVAYGDKSDNYRVDEGEPAYCGDGYTDPGEECDDGNTDNGDGCSAECTIEAEPFCGDGNIDNGEECDDGNDADGDGCSAECTLPNVCNDVCVGEYGCGNGYECNAGNCRNVECSEESDCTCAICGDGNQDQGEACDDGNNSDGDGCSADCSLPNLCDSTCTQEYGCSGGYICDGGSCRNLECSEESDCICAACGDGDLDVGEECDDGNNDNGDGCSAECTIPSTCDAVCTVQTGCGNGYLCSDGYCRNTQCVDEFDCTCAACGDGNLDVGEECDDGNNLDSDGCSSECTLPNSCNDVCTDQLGCNENLSCFDGVCRNFQCTSESDCACAICGDGTVDPGEQCDDGNATNGDGCSSTCNNEIPPVAIDDTASTGVNEPVDIDVLDNDSDSDGVIDPSTVNITIPPTDGTITDIDLATGFVTYDPDLDFSGEDTFTYEVCDDDGLCDTAEVTVYIEVAEIPPVANDDDAETLMDTPVDIDVLINDEDTDGTLDPSTVIVITPPLNGTITNINTATGEITYEPDPGYYGPDSFEYQVCDDDGLCDTAVVNIVVLAPPIANDDGATADPEVEEVIDVLINDEDPDGTLDPSTVVVTIDPVNGTITNINSTTGEITYKSNPGFEGLDTFTYEVCDDDGLCDTAEVTVAIDILAPPIANDDSGSTQRNTPIAIDVLNNDSDSDGTLDPGTVTVTTPPANGSISDVNTTTGFITYDPNTGFTGNDTYEYEVCDNDGLCDTAIVSIRVTGGRTGPKYYPPTANDDAAVTDVNVPVDIDILDNDTDPDNGIRSNSVTITDNPTSGTISNINLANGVVTYTPNNGFKGTDTFDYRVCDFDNLCDTATVTVTIGQLAPPVANDDHATTPVSTPVDIDILDNDSDPDGFLDPDTIEVILSPVGGAVTNINNSTGEVTYLPNQGFDGQDSFDYKVCDDDGLCDTATVTIDVISALIPPVAIDDSGATPVDVPITLGNLGNDYDIDGFLEENTLTVITSPTNGSVIINPTPLFGGVTYTPNTGFEGQDSFVYEICDNDGLCDLATVVINVTSLPIIPPPPPPPGPPPLVVPPIVLPTPVIGPISPTLTVADAYCSGRVYETDNIILIGTALSTPGTALVLEYSLTAGASWNPVSRASGLETGVGSFNVRLTNVAGGDHSLIIRATEPDGTIYSSAPCLFNVSTPLIFASNQFVVNSQSAPLSGQGVVQFSVNQPQTVYIEAQGATEASIRNINTQAEYSLTFNEALQLWEGTISFTAPGVFRLEGYIANSVDSYTREINTVLVAPRSGIVDLSTGQPIPSAEITIFAKDPTSSRFEQWNASAYGQSNPFSALGNGDFSVILPEGEFYLEVDSAGYNQATSLITQVGDNSVVTGAVLLNPQGNVLQRLAAGVLPGNISDNFALQVSASPDTSLLNAGDPVADVQVTREDGSSFSLFDQIVDEPVVIYVYNTWNTLAQEQTEIYNQVVGTLGDDYQFFPMSTIEPFNKTENHNDRGDYGLDDFKPQDTFYDDYNIITSPQVFIIGPDQTLLGNIVGPQDAASLEQAISSIIAGQ